MDEVRNRLTTPVRDPQGIFHNAFDLIRPVGEEAPPFTLCGMAQQNLSG